MVKKVVILLTALFFIVFLLSFLFIYKDVKANCNKAKTLYSQDCVGSLIQTIKSNKTTFREKNSAVWALDQLADKKTLSFLYELDKETPGQDRCSYDNYLCKYEIKKAIKWCENGNVTSWMYKGVKK